MSCGYKTALVDTWGLWPSEAKVVSSQVLNDTYITLLTGENMVDWALDMEVQHFAFLPLGVLIPVPMPVRLFFLVRGRRFLICGPHLQPNVWEATWQEESDAASAW